VVSIKKIAVNEEKCTGCRICELVCSVENEGVYNPELSRIIKLADGLPENLSTVVCQQCPDAPCIESCMSGAMYKDKKTGQTKHDKDKCVGCWMCIMTCPFGALTREKENKIVLKCDLCPDRDIPACVEACPTKALFLGTSKEFEKKICNT